jgi:hypothetical protein
MAKTRSEQLYDLGVAEYGPLASESTRSILRAFSVMLAEATKKATAKSKVGNTPTSILIISPTKLYEEIRDKCGARVLCVPYDKKWFGRLGKALQDIPDLEAEDANRLVAWLNSGALDKWPVKLHFGHLIKHLSSWVITARRYSLGTVGAPKIESAFR